MSFRPFNWNCPYCGLRQTVTNHRYDENFSTFSIGENALGQVCIVSEAIGCSNEDCKQVSVFASLRPYVFPINSGVRPDYSADPWFDGRLLPESNARIFPDFIPAPLLEDYSEACRVRDLSPKSSATLARRCLQGMIRDFCGISKSRLVDEITELKKRVDDGNAPKGVSPESVDAIDDVRGIGNIGAHMEKNIGLIVPVDPEEAQILIELIETLFTEWYVARQQRQDRFGQIKKIADAKKQIKADAKAPQIEESKDET